jgi:hypothetical protein
MIVSMKTLILVALTLLTQTAHASITDEVAGYDQPTYDACVDSDSGSDDECLERAMAVHEAKLARRTRCPDGKNCSVVRYNVSGTKK